MVARGHAWQLGGMRGIQGDVAAGGGACMAAEGHVWWGGVCMVPRGACVGYDKIWSMSRRYASYWNAFLLENKFPFAAARLLKGV